MSLIITDRVHIDAIDPETGERSEYLINTADLAPGWNDIEIRVGTKKQSIPVFKEPEIIASGGPHNAVFQFEVVELKGDSISAECNGRQIGKISPPDDGKTWTLPIENRVLGDWVCIALKGEGRIHSPRLIVDGREVKDARVERLESLRPDWFGDNLRAIKWDISCKLPMNPIQRPENRFFFQLKKD